MSTERAGGSERITEGATGSETRKKPSSIGIVWTRVGRTDEAKARWLLSFAFRDLDALSPGDWLNVRAELNAFVSSEADLLTEGMSWCSEDEIREMHRWVGSNLISLVLREGSTWNITPKVSFKLRWSRGELEDWSLPGGAWAPADLFQFRVYSVLRSQARRFGDCRECRRPFIARKRQTYCSARCSQTLRTRKFRSKHPKMKRS